VKALINTASEHNYDFKILKTVDKVNNHQRLVLFDKVMNHYQQNVKGLTLAVWGLAFKPETDDVREAPAKYIIQKLTREGATIQAYDPEAMQNFKLYGLDNVTYCNTALQCLDNADALLIITEWNEFKQIDIKEIKSKMKHAVVFDGRNIWQPKTMADNGFQYFSIGR
jgi:UDPglucose 6-dehydrogenase